MSDDRLILKRPPAHHKHKLLVAVAVLGLGVVGIWGFQMKTTYSRFTDLKAEQRTADAMETARENLEGNGDAAGAIQETVAELRAMLVAESEKEAAKQEVLDVVSESFKTEMSGEVAGETTEVPVN
ncbi:MAG: hypothetical protein WAZ14_01790 [Patescibacteria group bacterium]